MQSFIPGDIVTIKTKFDHNDSRGPGYDGAMEIYKGGTYKVNAIYSRTDNWYGLKSLNGASTGSGIENWIWFGEWLEPAQARPSITEVL